MKKSVQKHIPLAISISIELLLFLVLKSICQINGKIGSGIQFFV